MVILLCVSKRFGNMKIFRQFVLKNNFVFDFKIYVVYVQNWLSFKFLLYTLDFIYCFKFYIELLVEYYYSRIFKYFNDNIQIKKFYLGGFLIIKDGNSILYIKC